MERTITVRGHFVGPRTIDLDEPVEDLGGDVEVVLRAVDPDAPRGRDVFDLIAALPSGHRPRSDIDQQVAEERASWGDR